MLQIAQGVQDVAADAKIVEMFTRLTLLLIITIYNGTWI